MTLAYLGRCDAERLDRVKQHLKTLDVLPLDVKFGKDAMFGPKNDVAVRLCDLPEHAKGKLAEFYKSFAVPEPGMNASTVEQAYHVSKRGCGPELDRSTGFTARVIFIKQLGPHDPIFEMSV